jgi:hypothetical protein
MSELEREPFEAGAEQEPPPEERESLLRSLVGSGLAWLAGAEPPPLIERDLEEIGAALAGMGEPPAGPGTFVALATRSLGGGAIGPSPRGSADGPGDAQGQQRPSTTGGSAGVWSRYSRGGKVALSARALADLAACINGLKTGTAPGETPASLTRFSMREVWEELGVSGERAAEIFLDDLRERVADESRKRLERWASLPRSGLQGWNGYARFALNKNGLEVVFPYKEGNAAPRSFLEPSGETSTLTAGGLMPTADERTAPEASFWRDTGPAMKAGALVDGGAAVRDAKQLVRLVERLLELAQRYAVDLVGLLERYRETARRMLREAQERRMPRRLAGDKEAIERAFGRIDRHQVASDLGALPLYMNRTGGDSADSGTPIVPSLPHPLLQRAFANLWLRLLQPREDLIPGALAAPESPR